MKLFTNRHAIQLTGTLLAFGLAGTLVSAQDKTAPTFGDDLSFLKKHTKIILLSDPEGAAQVALAPAYQGRVRTSSSSGNEGLSFGWINRELIASGELLPHMNP